MGFRCVDVVHDFRCVFDASGTVFSGQIELVVPGRHDRETGRCLVQYTQSFSLFI